MSKGLKNLMERGMKSTSKASYKSPSEVTPSPSDEQEGGKGPIKIKLPKALVSDSHRAGAKVMHLAEGHHVKNDDGSTSFHMKSLDGEPVASSNVEPGQGGDANEGTGGDSEPFNFDEALKGMPS